MKNIKTIAKKTLGDLIYEKQEMILPGTAFKPTKKLYQNTGINQKRFGMILSGKVDPTQNELTTIGNYLKIDVKELF